MLWWEGYNCGVSRETFYDPKQIAILPMGFDPKVSETLVFLHTQELAVVIEGVHVVEVIWFAGGDEFVFWSLRAALLDIETLQPCRCRPRTEDPIHRCIVEEGELESSPVVLSGAHATATRPGLYSIRRRKRSPMS